MSLRGFVTRVFSLILVSVELGLVFWTSSMSLLSVSEQRMTYLSLTTYAFLGIGASIVLALGVFWRLSAILRSWQEWDGKEVAVQRRVLVFPGRFTFCSVILAFVVGMSFLYLDVWIRAVPLVPGLLKAVLTTVLILSSGLAIAVGLQFWLSAALGRVALSSISAWWRFPVWAQVTLATISVCLFALVLGGVALYTRPSGGMLGVLAGEALILALILGWEVGKSLSGRLRTVTHTMDRLAVRDMDRTGTARASVSLDEVGDLARSCAHFGQQAGTHVIQLRRFISDLETTNEEQRVLLETMAGLAAPLIPLARGVLVVPLLGYFDETRAAYIRPSLLEGIVSRRAQVVVIDLTGIAEVTEFLVNHLARAVRSAMLMGCQVVLTGISAEVAWHLTRTKSGLDALPAHRNLEDGLAYAYARLDMQRDGYALANR